MTPVIRNAVREAVMRRERPLLLGGCCALVPGALAGVRDAIGANVGVAYVDGHVDVYDGTTSPTGEAADMPLGVAFGRGPEAWVSASGGPSAAPETTVDPRRPRSGRGPRHRPAARRLARSPPGRGAG